MASSCSVDSHRSASRPSPLDKLVIAPLNTPVHGLHKNRPPHSPSPTKAQARTSRASTPCRSSCGGAPSITFNGLTKRYSVLPYGGALQSNARACVLVWDAFPGLCGGTSAPRTNLALAVGWCVIVKLIGTRTMLCHCRSCERGPSATEWVTLACTATQDGTSVSSTLILQWHKDRATHNKTRNKLLATTYE